MGDFESPLGERQGSGYEGAGEPGSVIRPPQLRRREPAPARRQEFSVGAVRDSSNQALIALERRLYDGLLVDIPLQYGA